MIHSSDPVEIAAHKVLSVFREFRRYSKAFQGSGITGRQISCLRYLHTNGSAKISDIANYLFIGASSSSELIDKLQKSGLVSRTRSSEDNRKVNVELTAKGVETAQDIKLGGIPLLRERLATLDAHSLQNIDRAFSDIAKLIDIKDMDSTT